MLTFLALAAALTLIACLAVLLPFVRSEGGGSGGPRDIDVYRDQLAEIEADEARGLIGAAEAGEARAELGRRILRAAGRTRSVPSGTPSGRWAAVAAIAAIPLISWGLYSVAGSPGLSDQPLASRLEGDPARNTIEELVARAERHLQANPDDGQGWSVIAPIYLRMGRVQEAVEAYRRAIRLSGADAARLSGLGEALVAAASGRVTPEALEAFEQALAVTPGEPKAQFFVALALAQAGDLEAATRRWQAMIAGIPAESPWQGAARQALAEAGAIAAGRTAGPSEDEVSAAADMPAAERQAMIEGMVASLAARLEENPLDPEGWERLIRSYIVLDRREEARAALARARTALAGTQGASERLDGLARELGLTDG